METARILIVEDEAVVALDLKRRLSSLGYAITGTAAYGAKAIDLAVADPPDLILMDVNIKGEINGIETARRIIEQRPVPVIFLTAHSDQDTLSQAKAVNPHGYLVKPFDEKSLQTTIEMVVYKHRMESQLQMEEQKLRVSEAERERLQAQLIQAQKMEAIGTLSGGIAHNFNNLLAGIQGHASLLAIDQSMTPSQQEHINAIETFVKSAADLTAQLLGLARGGKYEISPIDINVLLRTSASMVGSTNKAIRIHDQTQSTPLVAEADRRQIEQVLLNVIINAMHAMPGGGEISLKTSQVFVDDAFSTAHAIKAGSYVKISITDTGIGMDEVTQQRIFDPFFTTKEMRLGTGLGMSSAFGIMKNHGGTMNVSSELGQGSCFELYLPLSEQNPEQEPTADTRIQLGSETILLVDDEEFIRDFACELLEHLGYRVVAVASGAEAVEAITHRGDTIDLVMLDIIMPDMDGIKTFDRIRAIMPRMPVIFASGYSQDGQAIDIIQKGCNGFIQKPYNLPDLSQKIRKAFE
jgi:two-component system, cell cycle sensor histidine kinase and response regulator CckA